MKKMILLIVVVILAGLLAYRLFSGTSGKEVVKEEHALSISKNSDIFTTAFSGVMDQYYAVQAALVDWDSVRADQAATALSLATDSLPVMQIKADSGIIMTVRSLAAAVSSEAKGFVGETTLEQKRKAFNMLSDELYNLIRAVRYDRETIYHIKCPMAFGESEEGYWLSNTSKVMNPYLGTKHPTYKNKMLGCGEISDSLDFSKK